MNIKTGLMNGAVLQRDEENLCKVFVRADFSGNPTSNLGYFKWLGEDLWEFAGVFVGGPYEITVTDNVSSVTFTDVYVGDVWLLAGQSNMEASGYPTYKDKLCETTPNHFLRALYMEEEWKPAQPRISNLSKSPDAVHLKAHNDWINDLNARKVVVRDIPPYEIQRRVGPGLWFAEEMFKLTNGIPQGLIPTAVGGSIIDLWLPDSKNGNYYDAAARRVNLCGNKIKGVLWAQGEGNPNVDIYPDQIKKIRAKLCEQLGVEAIPFVVMQLFRSTIDMSYNCELYWSEFREMQRKMQYTQPLTQTIASNDLELCDRIHLSSDSQRVQGIRAAKAMYYLISGIGYPQPDIESIKLEKTLYAPETFTIIKIKFKNLCGDLKSNGNPFGFTLRKIGSNEKPSIEYTSSVTLQKNVVCLPFEGNIEKVKEYELFYGFGHDFYCNITDGDNRAIPSMGPIRIKDYI